MRRVPSEARLGVKPRPSREDLASLFLSLTSIPSPSGQERRVADLVRARLQTLGLEAEEDDTAQAIGGNAGNLYVLVPGEGERPAIAFGAHLDTVLPSGEMRPVLEDGVFRNSAGTILGADNKTAVAALLHAAEAALSSGWPFPTFELCFTVAEELGLVGAKHLAADRLRAPLAVMLDSSGPVGGVVTRAPSQQTIQATFRGKAAHAGLEPELGRNAILAASRGISRMKLGRLGPETTANVGLITGGVATNIVPEFCHVQAECRSTDEAKLGELAADMIRALQAGAAEEGVDVETRLTTEYRAFSLTGRAPVVKLTQAALASLGLEAKLQASGGGSDANILNERGIPTVNLNCGMSRVHTSDETLALDDLETVTRLVLALLEQAALFARPKDA